MSVRVTARLIGDVVIASGLPKSPLMIVQSIDEEAKMVHTTWFSDSNECQEGIFPGSALDRAEPKAAKAPAAKKASPKAGKPAKPAKKGAKRK
ncbi:MAG: hypothetical protein FWG77_00500 [Treponema sp.]|nr:hypothetical protein [Treponema sp.]